MGVTIDFSAFVDRTIINSAWGFKWSLSILNTISDANSAHLIVTVWIVLPLGETVQKSNRMTGKKSS